MMAPSRQTRKEQITAQRRPQILAAALDVFTSKGFAAATTSEIARTAGVAEGTLYNYFDNKRALFIAVVQELIISSSFLDLIDQVTGPSLETTLQSILENRLNLIDSKVVARLPSLMGEIQRDPELKKLWAEQFLQPFLLRMEGVFRAMMAKGTARRLEPSLAPRIVGGLILGFLMMTLMEGETSPLQRLPREQVIQELMEFVFRGFANDTETTKENTL